MAAELAVAAIAEVAKLLIMAQMTAQKNNLTPEQFDELAKAVRTGFEMRDPNKLPEV